MRFLNVIQVLVSLIGLVSFVLAVYYLTQGLYKEWITLALAPVAGICLAIVMLMKRSSSSRFGGSNSEK